MELTAPAKRRRTDLLRAVVHGELNVEQSEARIPRTGRRVAPLSYSQSRLWFLAQFEPGSPLYNISNALRMLGQLDTAALYQSVQETVKRHEILRTTFNLLDGSPVQTVHDPAPVPLPVVDLTQLDEAERKTEAQRLIDEEALRPFDLENGPLFRASLLRLAEKEHILLLTMHHIASDGWSRGILRNDLHHFYNSFTAGQAPSLPELPIQYADYAVWERDWMQGDVLGSQLDYWKQHLAGAPALLELPTDRPRPPIQSFRGATRQAEMPTALLDALTALAKNNGATLFMTLLAAFELLLFRYSGQDDIVIGTAIANRNRPETENLIGFLINTLALRGDLSGDPSFVELLARVRKASLGAYAHQDLPFEKLVEELQPERSMSHSPLFQIMFGFQTTSKQAESMEGVRIQSVSGQRISAKFDILLMVTENKGRLRVAVEYNTDLFDEDRIERLIGHYQTLLAGVVADPLRRISDLPLLSEPERRQMLTEWNDTTGLYPSDGCIHALFEEQVERTPDSVAIAFEEQTLTYRELNERANRLASYLRQQGVRPEALVGLYVKRSPEMIVGLLGILKAGGVYLPLDTANPIERTASILETAAWPLVLSGRDTADQLTGLPCSVLCLEDESLQYHSPENSFGPDVRGDNLAYVMFTSGSTGRPKGVSVPHRAVLRLVRGANYCQLGTNEVMLQLAPLAFDASTFEIWGSLLNGGRLVLFPGSTPTLEDISQILRRESVTILWLTAGLFHLMVEQYPDAFEGVRQLLAGGDVLSVVAVNRLQRSVPSCQLINGYGPTENTTFTCCYPFPTEPVSTVPIGRPISNTQVYILDRRMQPVPSGVFGELYTGGEGLSRGYLDSPELTADRFVPNPHCIEPGSRLYRTGDIVRWRSDGNIEFQGRVDYQVKLRGFRIELGEIEGFLLAHPDVQEAVVLAREDTPGDKRLVAYIGGGPMPGLEPRALRDYLNRSLPDYMVPTAFVLLDSLPLTPNGKVDRRALPVPEANSVFEAGYVAPRTPIEEGLVEVWSTILHRGSIGVYDSFFELGGHSLMATQVMSRIRSTFGVDLPLRALFEAPTIALLAERMSETQHEDGIAVPPLTQVSREQPVLLSFAQQRLWFIQQMEMDSPAYNVPVALKLTGFLDEDAIEQSLNEIVRRHEPLRTTFAAADGVATQMVHAPTPCRLPIVDLSGLDDDVRKREADRLMEADAQRPFDVENGPVYRASMLRVGPEEHILLVTIHHIASDGWSLGVLIRELKALYNAIRNRRPSPLPELAIQYADFAAWQRNWLQGEALDRQLSYWMNRIGDAPTLLELPADRPRPSIQSFRSARRSIMLPVERLAELKALGIREGVTLFMTLFAAFQTLMYRYSGQEDMLIGSPIANRTRTELEGLIGFFVNTLTLRCDLSGDPSFSELLTKVRESTLGAYAHQDLPFERLVEELLPERSLSHMPLCQVLFVLQNAPRSDEEPDGLSIRTISAPGMRGKFDLQLTATETETGLTLSALYSTDLFDNDRMERMLGHFQTLLEGIVADPNQKLSSLPLLTKPEREQLALTWNDTQTDLPLRLCLHQRIEDQVDRTPDAIALCFEKETLTYSQLDKRANQLANLLLQHGVGPDVLVGLCVERSVEMVVGLLGILKAGGAYVPLDPSYPAERLEHMRSDAGMTVVLTQNALLPTLAAWEGTVICLDTEWQTISKYSDQRPVSHVDPDNLAYVIYTSGSTGKPKGAMNSHRGICNRLLWMQDAYGLASSDRVLQKTPYSFDVSVWEFFWPFMVGASLVVAAPELHRDAAGLVDLVQSSQITTLHFVPSMLQVFLEEERVCDCASIRRVICSGEALPASMVKKFGSVLPAELHNLYGPTEAAVDVSYWACPTDGSAEAVPIGRPVWNTQLYVLDRNLSPAPIGVAGELYLGGVQLARGYLNRADLTAERFVPDPFSMQAGARLYKTGDLVKYLPDGNVEYLGRLDHQVKIRGFRIELGEIESALMQHPGVQEAVVLAREDSPGDKRLAAYVVAERSALAALDELRDAEAEQTSDWQAVFDANYAEPNPDDDPRFNIKGWNSSFTGLPIPAHEMAEWVDNTVERILALKPERVVEIGCGTGLLLFRIYPHCAEYIATDFSGEAIEYLHQVLAQLPEPTTQVNLQQKEASAFVDIGEKAPDTVILNSIVQYLPSVDYLMEVLDKSVASVAPGGRIFLGDIRSFAMLEEFQSSIQLSQASDTTERDRLWQRVKQAVAEEGELLLDPAFFFALRERLPRVMRIDVQAKRGKHWNEMTCFRYDVVLHIDTEPAQSADPSWREWTREGMSVSSLRSLLQEGSDIVAVTGIPNARTADAMLAHKMLAQRDDPETVSEIRAAMATQTIPSVDPEEIWALGDEYPYSIQICPSSTRHRGCVDAVLRRRNSAEEVYVEFPGHSIDARVAYASDPIRGKLMATFVPQLRRFTEARLPKYMIPAAFVLLETLPLSRNGKVDRKALPAPDGARPELQSAYESPQTAAEITLAEIWANVLKIERVGIHDNFFELGGDSILSIQIIARANQAGLKLSPRQIFQEQTIAELARVAGTGATMHAQQTELTGAIPLTPIQHWFFETNVEQPQHFNQARLLTLRNPIDPEIIEIVFKGLVTHHDALRLRFAVTDSGWQQSYAAPDDSTELERIDLTTIPPDQQGDAVTRECARLQESLNLQDGPLLRAAYFDMGHGRPARLFLVVHHLAIDGVSWRILLGDLTAGLQQLMCGGCLEPSPKTTSLQYWAIRLQEYADSEPLRQQLDFWLSDARRWVRPLPTDHTGGVNIRSSRQTVRVNLSEAQTKALLQDVPSVYHTQINDVLLTALGETICSWTGEREVLVDLEGHGREPLFEEVDLSRTTGWFTSLFPVLLDLAGSADAGSRLKAIKEQLRAIPERGMGYGLLRYMCGDDEVRSALKEMPKSQVMFNYHGHLDQVIEESGLFGAAEERVGDVASRSGIHSHSLDVLSRISGGRLHVGWHFSANEYERVTIERLASSYIEHLARLIEHCQSAEAGGFTPSDFPDANVSQQNLDRLLAGIFKK